VGLCVLPTRKRESPGGCMHLIGLHGRTDRRTDGQIDGWEGWKDGPLLYRSVVNNQQDLHKSTRGCLTFRTERFEKGFVTAALRWSSDMCQLVDFSGAKPPMPASPAARDDGGRVRRGGPSPSIHRACSCVVLCVCVCGGSGMYASHQSHPWECLDRSTGTVI
jgi:hypothetical protein